MSIRPLPPLWPPFIPPPLCNSPPLRLRHPPPLFFTLLRAPAPRAPRTIRPPLCVSLPHFPLFPTPLFATPPRPLYKRAPSLAVLRPPFRAPPSAIPAPPFYKHAALSSRFFAASHAATFRGFPHHRQPAATLPAIPAPPFYKHAALSRRHLTAKHRPPLFAVLRAPRTTASPLPFPLLSSRFFAPPFCGGIAKKLMALTPTSLFWKNTLLKRRRRNG